MQRPPWAFPRLSARCFNPHPAGRPDATPPSARTQQSRRWVSILIRPEGRMQPLAVRQLRLRQPAVSILIRPSGRMQRTLPMLKAAWAYEFQSSSGLPAGCNPGRSGDAGGALAVSILIRPSGRMQPPGLSEEVAWEQLVSILIRPEGRMQRDRQHQHDGEGVPVSILIRPEGRMQRRMT